MGSARAPTSAAVVLLGAELPVPAQDCVRRDDASDVAQGPPAERVAEHRQPPTLVVRQAKPAASELLTEHSFLSSELLDGRLLAASTPPWYQEYQELECVRHGPKLPESASVDQDRPIMARPTTCWDAGMSSLSIGTLRGRRADGGNRGGASSCTAVALA